MEPAVIDWKNIDSRFVRDDLLEDINAPQWVDFSAPDDQLLPDDAWFCRPDCRHPKTPEDFKNLMKQHQKSAGRSHLSESESRAVKDGTLQRRAGLTAAISSLGHHRTKSCRKFGDDNDENDNPNSPSPISAARILKFSVKSSAGRKPKKKAPFQPQPDSGQNPYPPDRFAPPSAIEQTNEERAAAGAGAGAAKLRSTVSARNLLGGGREIVNQVAEFWAELKRMALSSTSEKEEKKTVEKEPFIALTAEIDKGGTDKGKVPPPDDDPLTPSASSRQKHRQREVVVVKGDEENSLLPIGNMMSSKGGSGKVRHIGLSQVRSCPPTPQRFPSPQSNRFKHPKPTKAPTHLQSNPTVRGVLQEVVVVDKPDLSEPTNENGGGSSDEVEAVASGREEARPLDVLWFLKPCSYLAR